MMMKWISSNDGIPVFNCFWYYRGRHAHLDDPGRTEWEGFPSGTKAAAAGTLFLLYAKSYLKLQYISRIFYWYSSLEEFTIILHGLLYTTCKMMLCILTGDVHGHPDSDFNFFFLHFLVSCGHVVLFLTCATVELFNLI